MTVNKTYFGTRRETYYKLGFTDIGLQMANKSPLLGCSGCCETDDIGRAAYLGPFLGSHFGQFILTFVIISFQLSFLLSKLVQ